MQSCSRTYPALRRLLVRGAFSLPLLAIAVAPALAQDHDSSFGDDHAPTLPFLPGNLVLSRTVYDSNPANVKVGQILPPGCAATTGGCSASTGAIADGTFPYIFNNSSYDGSFGITAKIYLDQLTPFGWLLSSLEVPNSSQRGIGSSSNQMTGSFSSKSELGLHLSTSGKYLTFMGYVAPVDTLDVSNSNTPLVVDPTNPVGQNFYRAVATVDSFGHFTFTKTNAYSGNNGRSAILDDRSRPGFFFASGNAGNGSNPQPTGILLGAGAQLIQQSTQPESEQTPGGPTPVGSFNITLLGDKADKVGKDNNFRGITLFDNVVYFTKGSGGNGVNTVYFIDTTGTACPNGIGLPVAGATLPTTPLAYNPTTLPTTGLPSNMCILAGFPSVSAKTATTLSYPFGLWFADAKTLYVADEGDGYAGGTDLYTHAAAQTTAGLQKWIFNTSSHTWVLAYTLQDNLELGAPYTVAKYPTGTNAVTALPWAPATDGLRNLTGHVDWDGSVTVWAITSTVSGSGDQGADANRLVAVRDRLANTDPSVAAGETFYTLRQAGFAEVLRGIAPTPLPDFAAIDHAEDREGFEALR